MSCRTAAAAGAGSGHAKGFSYWSNELLGPGRHQLHVPKLAEAADDAKAARLWQLSEQLIQ